MMLSSRLLLVAFPLVTVPLIYLTGRLEGRFEQRGVAQWGSLLVMAVLWLFFLRAVTTDAPVQVGAVGFQLDGLGVLFVGLTLVLGTLAIVYSGELVAGEAGEEKYYAMLVGMIGALIGLACTTDLFNLWVWFELMVVTSYLLVAFYRESAASLEACVKYLTQSAVGSVFVVLGIALLLAQTGTTALAQLATETPASGLTMLAQVFFVVGFGVKIAIVPLHTWLPDAYAQSPDGVSAMLSGLVSKGGLIALLRVAGALDMLTLAYLLMVLGTVNIAVGNLFALRQEQVKRLLAYSSMSHIGYILLGVGIGFYSRTADGLQAGLLHMVNHGLMKALAFFAVGALIWALRSDNGLTVGDLDGLARRYPLLCVSLALALLSLGGLPPLAGFISKVQIFISGVKADDYFVLGLVAFAVLNTLISISYYLRLISAMFAVDEATASPLAPMIPTAVLLPILLLTAAMVILGVMPGLLSGLTTAAAQSIIVPGG